MKLFVGSPEEESVRECEESEKMGGGRCACACAAVLISGPDRHMAGR